MTAFVDTNILVRHLTGDPPEMTARATAYLRSETGLLLTDLVAAETVCVLEPQSGSEAYHFFWTPSYLERPDGSAYGVFMVMNHFRGPGLDHKATWGTIEHPDGRIEQMTDIVPELTYDPVNRRLRGGRVHCTMADGSTRTIEVEVVSDTGFHLGTGLYFGLDGHHHGEWRGELHVDRDRFEDCSTPETARRVHQIRDTVVRLTDPVGGGVGWGDWQPMGDRRPSRTRSRRSKLLHLSGGREQSFAQAACQSVVGAIV